MFLGVDGGGTKTAFCMLGRDGQIRARSEDTSCDYLSVGMDEAERVLADGIRSICRTAGITTGDLAFVFFGIPAYGEISDDIAALDAMPARILGHDRYRCDNDMVCGWAGSLGAIDGINVIAGTGSMTYGEYQGRGVRCGGWGWRFGDEGSAYWIANCGLNRFTLMSDGRLARGALHELFFEHLELHDAGDVIERFLRCNELGRRQIAELATIVFQAADAGDVEALAIVEQAAWELARIVETTRRQLAFIATTPVPVSYSGGVFQNAALVHELHRNLENFDACYELRKPLYAPDVGAAVYAAKLVGESITPYDTWRI